MRTALVLLATLMFGPSMSWAVGDTGCGEDKLRLNEVYPKDFNFHNKTAFLKCQVRALVKCIEDTLSQHPDPEKPLPFNPPDRPTLRRTKEGFVFEYNGKRGYEESCLGDGYKRDIFQRLYDAGCVSYEDKIKYLESFSCDARKNLECRQTGDEKERQFAEQATPVMKCLCPDYDKPQTYIKNITKGYYDKKLGTCVLKVGQICEFKAPQGLDERFKWADEDFKDKVAKTQGITIFDKRPYSPLYPCVNNSFCNVDVKSAMGLHLPQIYSKRCVCKHKYFQMEDGECGKKREDPTTVGVLIAMILVLIGTLTYFAGITNSNN